MEQSINIILLDNVDDMAGEKVTVLNEVTVKNLRTLVGESERLGRIAERLREKTKKVKRHAKKYLETVIRAHNIKHSENEAVGLYLADNVIYIGDKERITKNSESKPLANDRIVGSLLKHELRKYNELLDNYNYISSKIDEHNIFVASNEASLIDFEKSVLKEREYDKEKQVLVVAFRNGKVFLVNK